MFMLDIPYTTLIIPYMNEKVPQVPPTSWIIKSLLYFVAINCTILSQKNVLISFNFITLLMVSDSPNFLPHYLTHFIKVNFKLNFVKFFPSFFS